MYVRACTRYRRPSVEDHRPATASLQYRAHVAVYQLRAPTGNPPPSLLHCCKGLHHPHPPVPIPHSTRFNYLHSLSRSHSPPSLPIQAPILSPFLAHLSHPFGARNLASCVGASTTRTWHCPEIEQRHHHLGLAQTSDRLISHRIPLIHLTLPLRIPSSLVFVFDDSEASRCV